MTGKVDCALSRDRIFGYHCGGHPDIQQAVSGRRSNVYWVPVSAFE